MAKKKKTAKKKAPKRGPTTTATSKSDAPPKKSTAAKKAVPKRSTARGNSVDTLLKKYENERKTLESRLASSQKGIKDSELKVKKLQDQVMKLKKQAATAEAEMNSLDARRDAEIAEVLARLGVQLSAAGAKKTPPTPELPFEPDDSPEPSADDDKDTEFPISDSNDEDDENGLF